jgi:hypothetical protein
VSILPGNTLLSLRTELLVNEVEHKLAFDPSQALCPKECGEMVIGMIVHHFLPARNIPKAFDQKCSSLDLAQQIKHTLGEMFVKTHRHCELMPSLRLGMKLICFEVKHQP